MKTCSRLLLLAALSIASLGCDGAVSIHGSVRADPGGSPQGRSRVFLDEQPTADLSGAPVRAKVSLYLRLERRGESVVSDPPWVLKAESSADGTFEIGGACAPFQNVPMMIRVEAPGYQPAELRFLHKTRANPAVDHTVVVVLAPEKEPGR